MRSIVGSSPLGARSWTRSCPASVDELLVCSETRAPSHGVHLRLRALLVAIVSIAALAAAPPAEAWSNGPPKEADGFGTHDWFLLKAVKALGRKAKWVRLDIALQATDDPDSRNGVAFASDHKWHNYDVWGDETYGHAPRAVGYWFNEIRSLRADGDLDEASRALGIMAHLLADVAQPMHTDDYLEAEDAIHRKYEEEVDERCQGTPAACVYTFHYDGRDHAHPFYRTRRVAESAHERYRRLVLAFSRHHYNARVDRITKRQLDLGANALADVIASL